MIDTRRGIVCIGRERMDRAGGEARLVEAGLAGMRTGRQRREIEFYREQQCGAVGMPQPILRMDIEAERRHVSRPAAPCPGEEWQRRLVERKDGSRLEIIS